MTKSEILEHFALINDAYNNPNMRDDLSKMLDELIAEQQAERKEGHWEVFTMCANEGTYCSVCHTKIFDFVTPPKRKLSMFCPHCGAKMIEERISR